jgi:predicted nuclease of restriction endonuclease-like (RecB) superfamily
VYFLDRGLMAPGHVWNKEAVGKKRQSAARYLVPANQPPDTAKLLDDVRGLIEAGRAHIAQAVNAGMVLLYWSIGDRIRREILGARRAAYGDEVIDALSRQLAAEYGRGFGRTNLFNMVHFAEVFPDRQIVQTLSGQLGWSHFQLLLPLRDPLQRDFYAEMCRLERWSVRTLKARIGGMLFERTAIAKKPEQVARREIAALREQDQLSADLVFHDPYVLDFLRLEGAYSEEDLERAILRELEAFLLELGGDFSFVARQKRITVDAEDYYLDLLFFHRRLHRLVAIELKLDKFKAADKGQMELYLRWLDRYDWRPGEEAPVGLILCGEKSAGHVELLELEASGIRVAEYLTELPPRPLLERKLSEAIQAARRRLTDMTDAVPEG